MKQNSALAAVFGAMALVLITSGAVTYWMGVLAINRVEAVAHRQSVIDLLEDAFSTLKDAETGQRGYLLTERDSYLDPYRVAEIHIKSQLKALGMAGTSGDLPQDNVQRFVDLATQKLNELGATVDLQQKRRHADAVELVHSGEGKRTMDAIRLLAANMTSRQQEILAADRRSAERVTMLRSAFYAIAAVVNLMFLFWAFGRVQREMAGREAAALEVGRQKELLAVTLSSIGDAVIVTDIHGHISFMNEVAAQLTGWSIRESHGQLCSKIFNIINETSRAPVESPVEKVLRLGVIVGLANHTLLIRKDGSEIPIDDSGAPIREPGGAIRGVVLVFRDFSEHKAAERSLQKAKTDLENASRAKDQFLATLSHELRTPLTPVLATLTTWEASDELPEAFREDIQMLRRNIGLEARLIDDLLDLTRIVKGKLLLEPEVVDTHDLLLAVSGMYRSEIRARQVTLTMTLEATHRFANADPSRLQQVFWNILKNAAKFTPPGGRIEILTTDGPGGRLKIVFTDTGIGMLQQVIDNLFQPFQQGSEDVVRRSGGLGLGMAISKALMEMLGGTISASSAGPGAGSTFTLTLPSVPAPVQITPAKRDEEQTDPSHVRPLRILLVEDHADTARVMSRLLRRLGHRVQISDTVAGAADLALGGEFDVLLSDIGLPDGTGLDLIRQVKAAKNMPAIALTGFGMDEDIARCREAGFAAHLTKPVNFQRLEMVIRQVAGSKTG